MAPTTNKSKQPAKDFAKRPKAKVGKRAPKKLNATDTSFQTANVAVRSQDHSLDKNQGKHGVGQQGQETQQTQQTQLTRELISSRGNTLSTLEASLRHHAPAVRASGLRGIRDAVQSASHSSQLESNLPSLLPNTCRCWLDNDDDVRGLSLALFGDILKTIASHHSHHGSRGARGAQHNQNVRQYERTDGMQCLVPFTPLLCAYASSALNSLDSSVRKDGARIVSMLASSSYGPSYSLLASFSGLVDHSLDEVEKGNDTMSALSKEVGKNGDLFLPSLERLLSSLTVGGRNKKTNSSGNKRKSDGKPSKKSDGSSVINDLPASDAVILALTFLLHAPLETAGNRFASGNYYSKKRRLEPSLVVSGETTFLKGGSAISNSLLLFRQVQHDPSHHTIRREVRPMRSIADLPFMPTELLDENTQSAMEDDPHPNTAIFTMDQSLTRSDAVVLDKMQQLSSLIEIIRMKFVELFHAGRTPSDGHGGLMLSSLDLETLNGLIQVVLPLVHTFQSLRRQLRVQLTNLQSSTGQRRQRGNKKSKGENQERGQCIVAFQASVTKLLGMLFENFPFRPMDSFTTQAGMASQFDLVNAITCLALAELGEYGAPGKSIDSTRVGMEDPSDDTPKWVDAVFSYILPRLSSKSSNDDGDSKKEDADVVATHMLLHVVRKLLLPQEQSQSRQLALGSSTNCYLLRNPHKRYELLEAFGGTFFPRMSFPSNVKDNPHVQGLVYTSSSTNDDDTCIETVALSVAGRSAVMLLTSLIAEVGDGFSNPPDENGHSTELNEKRMTLILQMTSILPKYLSAWKDRYPKETGLVLASIISVVRQWSASIDEGSGSMDRIQTGPLEPCLTELCLGLRISIELLFEQYSDTKESQTTKAQPKKKSKKIDPSAASIFERLPEQIQKLCVGLVGMLKCPTEELASSLSIICSKSFTPHVFLNGDGETFVISATMANYIMEVMHSLRKTMSMPMYLTFLIDSTGIDNAAGVQASSVYSKSSEKSGPMDVDQNGLDNIFMYDKAVQQLARFLTTCCNNASTKVLPMIRPILEKWMTLKVETSNSKKITSAKNGNQQSVVANGGMKSMVHSQAAISIVAAFTWDKVCHNNIAQSAAKGSTSNFLPLDENLNHMLLESFFNSCESLSSLLSMEGWNHIDSEAQDQFLSKFMGPIFILLRYCSEKLLILFFNQLSQRIRIVQTGETLLETKDKDAAKPSGSSLTSEIYVRILLLLLKAKDPVSIVTLIKRNNALKDSLRMATTEIEKSISDTHLAMLIEKLTFRSQAISEH